MFKGDRLSKMVEAHSKLYEVNYKGIKDTTYWNQSEFTDVFASYVHDMERNQDPFPVVGEILSFDQLMWRSRNVKSIVGLCPSMPL